MVHVELDAILTEEDALQRIKDIFDRVENEKVAYVITHNGRPTLAIVDIATLEHEGSGEPFHTPESATPAETAPEPTIAPEAPIVEPAAPTPIVPTEKEAPMVRPNAMSDTLTEELPPMPDMPTESPITPAGSPLASLDEPSFPGDTLATQPVAPASPISSAPVTPTAPSDQFSPAPSTPSQPSSPFASVGEPETDLENSSPLG